MRSALLTFLLMFPQLATAQIAVLNVSPTRLTFLTSGTSQLPQSQAVRIRNIGSGSLLWHASASVPWIKVTPYDGNAPATISVSVEVAGLKPGDYRGRVTVAGIGDVDDSPAYIDVTLTLVAASKSTAESSPPGAPAGSTGDARGTTTGPGGTSAGQGGTPTGQGGSTAGQGGTTAGQGGTARKGAAPPVSTLPPGFDPAGPDSDPSGGFALVSPTLPPATRNLPYSQAIQIKGGTPPYNVRIIQGRLPPGMTLRDGSISGSSMAPGNYPITIGVSDSSRPPKSFAAPLMLRVIQILRNMALMVQPASVQMSGYVNLRVQSARLTIQSGGQPLEWHATTDADWLRLVPSDGLSPSFLQLETITKDMVPGAYVATVTITMEGVPNSPARIPVQLIIRR